MDIAAIETDLMNIIYGRNLSKGHGDVKSAG